MTAFLSLSFIFFVILNLLFIQSFYRSREKNKYKVTQWERFFPLKLWNEYSMSRLVCYNVYNKFIKLFMNY